MRARDERARGRATRPASSGYCSSSAEHAGRRTPTSRGSTDAQLDAERLGARSQHVDRLRKAAVATTRNASRSPPRCFALHAVQQRHRLGRGRRLVEQRRVRDLHPRQVAHHRLEVEQRLEAALRDLGLVRRVRRVPAGVLQHVAQDDARRDRVVVAEADEGAEHAGSCAAMLREARAGTRCSLSAGGSVERPLEADATAGIASSISASSDGAPTACEHPRRVRRRSRVRCGGDANRSEASERARVSGVESGVDADRRHSPRRRRVGVEQRAGFGGIGQLDLDHPAPCGSVLTVSGLSFSAALTSTTSPDTGANSSDTAFTDSIVPNDFALRRPCGPTSGSSTYTTSPSCCWA